MPDLTPIDANEWIRRLDLIPHPEGGYFRETYRSSHAVRDVGEITRERSASTAIYFLLRAGDFSALHRIASDEVWHFYAGVSVLVSAILPDGSLNEWRLGTNLAAGDVPQCVVPAGAWFGAELVEDDASGAPPLPDTAFALVGCTVAPGFEFVDFELGERDRLSAAFPHHLRLIARLTRSIPSW